MLLAIDTSAGTSVAVVDYDRGVLAEASDPGTRGHAERIGRLIADALAESGVAPAELSAVAAGMGPGPFTGLRVGIVAARAFALAAGKPVVNLVSHDAIAFGAYRDGERGPLLVVTDARRREVYWSYYDGADEAGLPLRADGPALAGLDELPLVRAARLDADHVSAAALGLLAEHTWKNGRPFASDQALYLRSPDVTPSAGPKRVTG
ncbi:tRNA (adenosine(37)-N6)-threonylcarbamoyltransferase complex dimerization subunit type 1 TsaB [Gryllotalpicola protaetiae]|uniref:tRNA (Adenosine(37)-N6)-threonylcarbamoyltransferase complex dimerization subunit type 1 TsaB n=1 Tax=Gryllotalpicola protaetiae TaxID=2419771 RepID=A0A387BFY9_9MICO|nr:tRNA (adenosine(37)-N6)-threonylcarbamoyltransferase complex dimerization subunit type 1 TsaB [Gryllotalpicola protaetiae]AYG02945.1 tRNA (adenosine(37)-N6)-threonylcarbamoyltransferase complex dimerization subunit type 1 TsaB [Gryllotalpicola protaetiae]